MKWRAYYDDHSTYSDYSGSPFDAPARGVQCIAIEDPDVGRFINHQKDYYVYANETWQGVDIFGLFDYLIGPGPKKVLFGRTISNAEYRAIFQRAVDDDYLPVKGGRKPAERSV